VHRLEKAVEQRVCAVRALSSDSRGRWSAAGRRPHRGNRALCDLSSFDSCAAHQTFISTFGRHQLRNRRRRYGGSIEPISGERDTFREDRPLKRLLRASEACTHGLRENDELKLPRVLLLSAVVIWGWTFVATKILVAELGPVEIFALRLAIGLPFLGSVLLVKRVPLRFARAAAQPLLLGGAIYNILVRMHLKGEYSEAELPDGSQAKL